MTNNHATCTLLQGIAFHAEGEANFYRLMRNGNWLARVQFNGELLVWDQEQLLNAMLQGQQAAPVGERDSVTVLPDGSAFGVVSFPLPRDHWLYAEREYDDGADQPKELPAPILTHELRSAVEAAVRYAVRGATDCGKESDFDPDALVQNAVYALCGPFGAAHQRQEGEYGDAYQGAREDLAIWKRRALAAEARVRQQDQIIDQMGEDLNAINGPTFMGEPVLPRQQAREVVMPEISAMAKVLSDRAADACNINRDDNWAMYGQEYIDDVQAMLEVARLNGDGSHE